MSRADYYEVLGVERGASEAELTKPKLYILAVGVAEYRNPSWSLNFPAKDATDFVEAMRLQEGGLYSKVEFKLLTDKLATKDNILDGLEWVGRQTTSRDVAMVFFAGHGVNDNLNRYFFCSHNFEEQSLMRTGVAYSDIKSTVEAIAGKALFFVDTCHAGNAFNPRLVKDAVDASIAIFAATDAETLAQERPDLKHGVFTYAVLKGLAGAADSKTDRQIQEDELSSYVNGLVSELTGGKQKPDIILSKPADFVLTRY